MEDAVDDNLVKSRQRVIDHGEVFTPPLIVEEMLDLLTNESARIDARFLEPACGSGNFLVAVLTRKLLTVQAKYGKNDFEKRHYALLALMCIYGIEILEDNVLECRQNLLSVFRDFLQLESNSDVFDCARIVLKSNIVRGDALKMQIEDGTAIVFPEWAYLTKGKFARRDFRFDNLTERSAHSGTLFELMPEQELFVPVAEYPRMSIEEICDSFSCKSLPGEVSHK